METVKLKRNEVINKRTAEIMGTCKNALYL